MNLVKLLLLIGLMTTLNSCGPDGNLLGSGPAQGDGAPGGSTFNTSINLNSVVSGSTTVSGACAPGQSVELSSPDLDPNPQTFTCPDNGQYSETITFVDDIDKQVKVTVTSGGKTAEVSVVVDSSTPNAPVIATPFNSDVTSSLASTITGQCEDGNTVNITGGIDPTPTTTTCNGGFFSVGITLATGDGVKTLNVSQTDKAGNTSSTDMINVNLDTTLPTVTIDTLVVISNANASSYSFNGTCSENGRTVTVSVGGTTPGVQPTCTAGAWSITGLNVSGVADGANIAVLADHDDAALNNAVQAQGAVVKDTIAPGAPSVIAPPSGGSVTSTNQTVIGGNCEAGDIVTVAGDINPSPQSATCSGGSYSIPVELTAGDGVKNFTVTQTDNAGNTSPGTLVNTTLDTTPPAAPVITAPVAGVAVNNLSQNIAGTCETNAIVEITGDFTPSPSTATCAGGNYSIPVSLTSGDGVKNISVKQTDIAGNDSALASSTVSLDTVDPTVAITSTPAINSANEGSYDFSGTCTENGETVTVSVGSTSPAPQPICMAGVWTVTGLDVSGEADSDNLAVLAQTTDEAGNTSDQVTTNVLKDATPPAAPVVNSPANNDDINSLSQTIVGICETGSTVNITGDIDPSPTTGACVSGAYSIPVTLTTGDAVKNLSLTQTDDNGNTSGATALALDLDTTVPAVVTITAPTGTSASKTQNVTGACETGTTVSVTGDITPSPVTGTCTGGAYSIAVELTAVEEAKNLIVNQTDDAGNTSADATGSVTLDTTLPTVSIAMASNINLDNSGTYSLNGACSENGRDVVLSIGGIAPSPQPVCTVNAWSITNFDTTSAADSASFVITADHDDAALNNAVQASVTIIKDVSRPAIPTLTAPVSGSSTNSSSIAATGACETGATVSISGDIVPSPTTTVCAGGAYSVNITYTSGDGVKNLSVSQSDPAGNTSDPLSASVTVDTTVAIVTITNTPVINSSNESNYSLSGTCSENGQTVTISAGGIAPAPQPICIGGAWSVVGLDVSGAADNGNFIITADTTDLAGNAATQASETTIKDTTAPGPVALTYPLGATTVDTNDTSQTIIGTCESGSTVSLSGNFSPNPATGICTASAFSIDITLTAGEGVRTITSVQTDVNGNTSTTNAGSTGSFQLDTTSPNPPTITAPAGGSGVNNISQTVTGSCEAGSTVSISGDINPKPVEGVCTGGGTYSINVVLSGGDGSKTITSKQTDVAGNESTQTSSSFILDSSTPPAVVFISPANNASTNQSSQTLTGTCESGIDVVISGDLIPSPTNGPCINGSFSIPVVLSNGDGTKNMSATQTDIGGNTSSASSLSLNFDTTPPSDPSSLLLASGWVNGNAPVTAPSFSWTASTGAIAYEVALGSNVGGTDIVDWTDIGNGVSYDFSGLTGLQECIVYWPSVRAKDKAGNVSSDITHGSGFRYDNTKPSSPAITSLGTDISVGGAPTISFNSGSDNCEFNQFQYGFGTSSGSTGVMAFTNIGNVTSYKAENDKDGASFNLSPGQNHFSSIKATDAAGNVSSTVVSSAWALACVDPYPNFNTLLILNGSDPSKIIDENGRDANHPSFTGNVQTWLDSSSNGFDLDAPSASQRPIYNSNTAVNAAQSNADVEGDGNINDQTLSLDINPDISSSFTFVYVFKAQNASPSEFNSFFSNSTSPSLNGAWQFDFGGGAAGCSGKFRVLMNDGGTRFSLCGPDFDTENHVMILRYNNATKLMTLSFNGTITDQRTWTNTPIFRDLKMFENRAGGSFQAVKASEVSIIQQILTQEEEDEISDYLVCKWNVAL